MSRECLSPSIGFVPRTRGWAALLLIIALGGPPGAVPAFAQAPADTAPPAATNPPANGATPQQPKPADDAKKKKKPPPPKKKTPPPAKAGAAAKPDPSQTPAKTAAPQSTPTSPADATALAKAQAQVERLSNLSSTLIQLLVQQGVITREKGEELMQQAQLGALPPIEVAPRATSAAPAAAATAAGAGVAAVAGAPSPSAAAPVATAPGATGPSAAAPTAIAPVAAAAVPEIPASDASLAKEEDVVRVPYVPEVVKNEIRDQVRDEVLQQAKAERWGEPGTLPEWLDRFSFDGDLRFRFQENLYGSGNTPAPTYNAITGSTLDNTTQDQSLYFIRARFGINAAISDPLFARLSITTGNGLNPVNLNQNLANYSSGLSLQLTDAYLRYTPADWATGWIGQFPKPFVSTDMLFWDDLVMDGVAGTFNRQFTGATSGFATLGAFLIQNTPSNATTPDPKTKALFGAQVGGAFKLAPATRLNVAMALYDFNNIQGIPNPSVGSQVNDWSAPLFRQKGNSVFNINYISNPTTILYGLAPEYRIFDLNGSLELAQLDPYVVKIGGDFAQNFAYNQGEIFTRTGLNIDPQKIGYQVSLMAGKPVLSQLNDWQAFFIYRHLQRDAVVDAFNDPEFFLGGTNYKGYQIGLRYGLGSRVWLRARWMSADQISGPPLAIDVFQLDLNAKF